ncbi:MAG: Dabb family protein [Microbacterium enclense]
MFRHVVLIRIRDQVPLSDVASAVSALRSLGAGEGVEAWTVAMSLDTRKGQVIVVDGSFRDQVAFDAWRRGPAHRRVAEDMSLIADWFVGDWEATAPAVH